jgi:hypothetical protein
LLLGSGSHSKIRDININYDKVVIGSSLEALTYACLNNLPVICSSLNPPHRFETFSSTQDLSILGTQNYARSVQTNFSEKTIGIDKLRLWEKLFFFLSASGLCPLVDKVVSLRITDNILKAATAKARLAKIHFNELIIFDDKDLHGIGVPKIKDEKYEVHDWFDVRSGMKHDYDQIEDTTDFVNHILFYPSDRVEGTHNFKDAVAISYLTKAQLEDFEYSDINARFKTLYMMKKCGIRGARNGRDVLDKTKYKYYSVKIENTKREIIKPRNIYESFDNITFNYDSFGDIIKTPFKESYVSKIINQSCRY